MCNTNNNEIFRMHAGARPSSLQGPDALKGRNSLGTVLPREVWVRALSALRKLVTPFLVLLSPALREPHNGLVAGRESLASLDSAAPNRRLAFLLRVEGDRVALFD
jgi:hypothetical protein